MTLPKFSFSIPTFLVITTTFGFFALMAMLVFHEPPAESRVILQVLIGSVSSSWGALIGYYFGSSSGSAKKTDIMLTKKEGE